MRFGKVMLCFLSVIFLTVIVCFGVQMQRQKEQMPFSVVIQADGRKENVKCWQNEAGEYYIFLPSYADLTHATISFDRNAVVSIDNQLIENGVTCEFLQLDTPYALKYANKSRNLDTTLTFLQSGNVPTIYIDVQSGSMDYIHAVKGNEESGKMRLYSADGGLEYAGSIKSINGRGNSTWYCSKKPYSLSLTYEADLLGMGAAEKWILLANAYDASNLRNKIAYDFAQAVGLDYSPQCQWVDLYLNGDYAGLYLLSTRNEIHEQRVAISEKNSFLVSMELQHRLEKAGIPFINSDCSVQLAFRIHDATMEIDTLQAMLQSMENAILAEDGVDPATGIYYTELVDIESWAKRYLIDEVFSNFDGGSLSQFFYFDGASELTRIYAGPVWDMDDCLAYSPNTIWGGRPHLWESTDEPLFYSLLQKREFYQEVLTLFDQVFQPELSNVLDNLLEEYSGQIFQAACLNAIRWNTGDVSQAVAYIRDYLEKRIDFLNDYYFGDTVYFTVQISAPYTNSEWICYAVRYGDCLPNYLPWYTYTEYKDTEDSRYLGWYTIDTDEPFDITEPIFSDVTIYPKWESIENEPEYENELEYDIQTSNDEDSISKWAIIPLVVLLGLLAAMFVADFVNSKRSGGQKK
ncbi:MAG: CotH kinase family protein [Eubacteriales bacterium]|nr:CotH kinase family protein [Eubacteriales bacterium]